MKKMSNYGIIIYRIEELIIMEIESVIFELFISIHFTVFVLMPLSQIVKPEDKKLKWKMLAVVLPTVLLSNFVIDSEITISLYFISVFLLGFPLTFISIYMKNKNNMNIAKNTMPLDMVNNNAQATVPSQAQVNSVESQIPPITPAKIDPIYSLSETVYLEKLIDEELKKNNAKEDITTPEIEKRRRNASILLSIIIFISVSLIFFHINIFINIILLVIGVIFYKSMNKVSLKSIIIKDIKSRPDEKINNIIVNNIQDKVEKKNYIPFMFISLILPLIIFSTPHIMYEKTENGYHVRFYTMGLFNMTKVDIPSTHNGEKVIGLRGDTFVNMFFLKEVNLPDTIEEIRGGAFRNTYSLSKINLPSNLKYLGGGAFKNSGITEIYLPDSLEELRGETFQNAGKLKTVKLPNNITEIRGNTFENAVSLESIDIPEGVTRIGGHAFYGCTNLSEVNLPSTLSEIASSAFRNCSSLREIIIPRGCYVNYRAFKNSPTYVKYTGDDNYNPNYNSYKKIYDSPDYNY